MESFLIIGREQVFFSARNTGEEATIFVSTAVLNDNAECGMQNLFWEHPVFALPYKSTEIIIEDGSPFVVVPNDLVDSASPEKWLGVASDLRGRKVLTQAMGEERSSIIYSISQELFDFTQRSFSAPSYSHGICALCQMAMRQTRREYARQVLVNISSDYIQVVVAEEGQLLLANKYSVSGDSDIIYYLTAVFRQFKFNPHDTPLSIFSLNSCEALEQKIRENVVLVEVNNYPYMKAEYERNKIVEAMHPHLVLHLLCE